MPDMLVSLLHLPQAQDLYDSLEQKGIRIQRAMTPDKLYVVKWVKDHFGAGFAGECDASFSHHPVSCFLAVQDRRILGFACYNATYPDFFGPTAVLESQRGSGIGKALLIRSLEAVSYTHLDVYKRQPLYPFLNCCTSAGDSRQNF